MLELSDNALKDIVRLNDGSAWIETIDVVLPDGFVPSQERGDMKLVSEDENGKWHILMTNASINAIDTSQPWQSDGFPAGKVYLCVPYKREAQSELRGEDGEQTMSVSIADTGDVLWDLSNRIDGFRGCTVILGMSQVKSLIDGLLHIYPQEIASEFTVRYTSTDRLNFCFFLASSSPFSRQHPQRRMFKAQCRWVFKGPECGYTGSASSCPRTIAGCRALGNIQRIGCFPGCGTGGLAQ